jgi:outer membrane biosynthesis protein TonB
MPEPVPASPSSSRTGLIIGVVAAVIVIAAGFLGYRALYGSSGKPSVAASEPPKAMQPSAAPAAPPEPVKDTTPVAAAPAEPPAPAPSAPPMAEPAKTAAAEPALPGTPAAQPPKPRPAPKPAPKVEPPAAEPAPAPPPAAKTPAKTTTVAAAPAAAAQPDHWQMYADALGRCAREDFFKRLGCELRTRNQYCQGHWGQVPQCPEATPRDRGQ